MALRIRKVLGRLATGGLFLLCLATLATGVLFAQSAELCGFVTDPSAAVVAGASLELRNQSTGVRSRVATNRDGLYCFPVLKPGTYDVTVQAEGLRTLTRDGLALNVDDRAGLDFSLELRGPASSITVSADTPLALNQMDAAVSTIVDRGFVANMPLNGRSFQSLIHLTPGVVIMPAAQDEPGQFSVNGQRTNTNYFMIDGVSANFGTTPGVGLGQTISGSTPGLNILGGTNSLVSVDAMQEFRIQTSSYAPEYGRTPGAQISILTASGSNRFHGTAYDYFRNDLFDARNWFNTVPQPKPPLRQNDFGGTFGGPIVKDHTFFFASYEGLRLRQPATDVGDFLTAAARARAPPVYQRLVNAYPIPTGHVNSDGITAPLTMSYSDPARFDATSLRVDHATNRTMIFVRYNHAPSTQGSRAFSQLETDIANIETATAGATFIVSTTAVNDFRANWSRSTGKAELRMLNVSGALAPPESALFPAFAGAERALAGFGMPFTSGGVGAGTRSDNIQRQLNLVDTFSITTGANQLKFGIDFRRVKPTNSPLNYSYATSPNNYQTLLQGKTNLVIISTSDPITARLDNYSLFAQDTWKLSDRLTLTYGMRWEVNTPPQSATQGKPLYAAAGIFDSQPLGLVEAPLWRTRFDNFAPRLGVAWRLTANSVVRGGGGVFYDLGYGRGRGLDAVFPYTRSTIAFNNAGIPFDLNGPAFQPLPFTIVLSPATFVQGVDPHLALPVTYQWNVAWQYQFGSSQSLTATYVGARGDKLLRQDPVTPPGSVLAMGGGTVGVAHNADHSRYDGLQLQLLRRMSRGLQVLVSYSLAKSTDTGSSDTGFGQLYPQNFAANVSALPVSPWAPSNFDARQLFSAALSWELPGWGKAGRRFLKGWAVDGIIRAHSALPLNVVYQRLPGSQGAYNVQPDTVPGQPFWIPDKNQPRGDVLNPNAFAIPAGASGDFHRNSLRGFPFSQADLALRRRFRLTERLTLDARAEYFNVFNHPVFASPETLWGAGGAGPLPSFGKVSTGNTLNVGLGGGGLDGGQAAIYAPGGPRSAQFTLKLSF